MKKTILALACIAMLASCNKETENQETVAQDTIETVVEAPAVEEFISENGAEKMTVIERNDAEETITIKKESTGEEFKAKRVVSADGEKYQDESGKIFWLKGDELMFGENEQAELTIFKKAEPAVAETAVEATEPAQK